MPFPSYIELRKLLFSISVKSKNLLNEYNWFCKLALERYNSVTIEFAFEPKQTEGEKGGGVISCLTLHECPGSKSSLNIDVRIMAWHTLQKQTNKQTNKQTKTV